MRKVFVALGLMLSLQSVSCAESPDAPIVPKVITGNCNSTPEICGDNVDQDCDGQDTLCVGVDQDRDGFPLTQDCDDTDRKVFSGVRVACDATCGAGTQLCQTNGTFGACSCEPLCEATGSGRCYYVSALTGSDSNPGTFAQPFKSYLNFVSYYNCSTQCPPNHRPLQAGDVVYFMNGIYKERYTYTNSNDSALRFRGIAGTAQAPIVLKAYPGAEPIISPPKPTTPISISGSHIVIDGIEVRDTWGGILVTDASNITIRRVWVHEVDGEKNNNMAGVYITNSENVRVHNSFIHDNYDHAAASSNPGGGGNRNISLFTGGNIRIDHNVIFHSQPNLSGCVLYKHSQTVPGGVFEIDHNILWNCEDASIGSGSYSSKIHHNLIVNSVPIGIKDWGGPTHLRDIDIYNNTFANVRGSALYYVPVTNWGPLGSIKFRNNVVVGNAAENTADPYQVINAGHYSSDELYNAVVGGRLMTFSNNCYFNAPRTPVFGLFARNGAQYRSSRS